MRGPGRSGELPARADALAGEPARLLLQGATSTSSSTCWASTDRRHRAGDRSDERPTEVEWRTKRTGKLDLFTTIDFRHERVGAVLGHRLPAATWYEKHDISSTDLHPFVHAFDQAIPPPWEARSDWDAFSTVAERFQELAKKHLGVRRDLVAAPLLHDTPEELAQPGGVGTRLEGGECEPIPGKTMPKFIVVERDYGVVHDKMTALGPLVENAGIAWKGIAWKPAQEVEDLRRRNGIVRGGVADGRPQLRTAAQVAEAIFRLSGTTNGRLAVEGFRQLEARTGTEPPTWRPIARTSGSRSSRCASSRARSSRRRSGRASKAARRYSPFTVNVDRGCRGAPSPASALLPGPRLDARVRRDCRPTDRRSQPRATRRAPSTRATRRSSSAGSAALKWSIHSEYQDNLRMLELFRGGPVVWISPADAERIGAADNDWVEAVQPNGVIACRAVVSHRIPEGSAFMYHSQDRHVNVPISETSGTRGGTDNSVTRIIINRRT